MAQDPSRRVLCGGHVAGRSTRPIGRLPTPVDPASFRDPNGFVFRRDGVLLRQIQPVGLDAWTAFLDSGLYASLASDRLIVDHEVVDRSLAATPGAAAVIRPRELPFISYPFEWSFGQLRDAALLTLELQRRALAAGMRLRDASAYNIQFDAGRPVLIDSLSFDRGDPSEPWVAYRQFCEHFLVPLALTAYRDVRLQLLLRDFIDGIPLDFGARLLPFRTRLSPGLLAHVHVHAGAQRSAGSGATRGQRRPRPTMSQLRHEALIDGLRRLVEGLRWTPGGEWVGYGRQTSYTAEAADHKVALVERLLAGESGMVWDLGANVGTYSGVAAKNARVIAFDRDASSVEHHWRSLDGEARRSILPIVLDLTNPSPALGWHLSERRSLVDRGPADTILALALIHHLAIGNNVPLPAIAALFASLGRRAIVEFVPKDDEMVGLLLATRPDVFPDYTIEQFREAFATKFTIEAELAIEGSRRTLFLLHRL